MSDLGRLPPEERAIVAQHRIAATTINTVITRRENEFRKEQPNYDSAMQWLRQYGEKQMEEHNVPPENREPMRQAIIQQLIIDHGRNFCNVLYSEAERLGYKPHATLEDLATMDDDEFDEVYSKVMGKKAPKKARRRA